jgi:flagellar biosynthesis protein FlhF
MAIKRFVAKNMRTALQMVRDTLGNEAIIMEEKAHPEGVEVLAGIKGDRVEMDHNDTTKFLLQSTERAQKNREKAQVYDVDDSFMHRLVEKMQHEFHALRSSLDVPIKNMGVCQSALLKSLLKMGLAFSISEDLARSVPENVADLSLQGAWLQAMKHLKERICYQPYDGWGAPVIIALRGLSGSAKTSSLASMATLLRMRQPAALVVLASSVGKGINANASLRAYARLLNMPFVLLKTKDDYDQLIHYYYDYQKAHIFIDTDAGYDQSLWQEAVVQPQQIITLEATQQYEVLKNGIAAFGKDVLSGAVLSKCDEATSLGESLSALIEASLPLVFYTQDVKLSMNVQGDAVMPLIERWMEKRHDFQNAHAVSMAELI